MANPFLMTEDDVPQETEPVCNPFLIEEADNTTTTDDTTADNPFFADAKNPFADVFGADAEAAEPPATVIDENNIFGHTVADEVAVVATSEPDHQPHKLPTNNIDSAMSFFGTTISDEDEHDHEMQGLPKPMELHIQPVHISATSTDDEEVNQHLMQQPPQRPVPPSRTTQDLILSVSDQLDQNSSHMLNRIPVTRTPSPVSMRDLHTPSPTGDLLDVSDGPPANMLSDDAVPAADDIFGVPSASENPFASIVDDPATTALSATKAEPPRPPPPRPTPPRPSPPRRPSPPEIPTASRSQQQQPPPPPRPAAPPVAAPPAASTDHDLFDMFGTSDIPAMPKKPPPPKSKEDILSLFSVGATATTNAAPVNTVATDLLSGDILSMDNADFSAASAAQPPQQPNEHATASFAASHVDDSPYPPVPAEAEQIASGDASDADALENVSSVSPVISDIQPEVTASGSVEKENNILDGDADSLSPSAVSTIESVSSDNQQHLQQQTSAHQSFVHSGTGQLDYESATKNAPPTDLSDNGGSDIVMDTTLDFGIVTPTPSVNPFASPEAESDSGTVEVTHAPAVAVQQVRLSFNVEPPTVAVAKAADEFDAFAAKFESVKKDEVHLLDGFGPPSRSVSSEFAWGNEDTAAAAFGDDATTNNANGFGAEDDAGFDSFLAMAAPPREESDDEADKSFSVVIRPRDQDAAGLSAAVGSALAPPPPRSSQNNSMYSGDSSPRVNPFDKSDDDVATTATPPVGFPAALDSAAVPHMPARTDSQETPPTPLFDEDVSQPLEDFPRVTYVGDGWEMQLRQPNKKKITGQRFWKKIWLRVINPHENPVIQLRNAPTDKEPFQELPLQACYSVSDICAQQFDQFGKIFTVKLQYIFYKERPGVRPGQVTKAERLTNKLSQFAAYAIQGDYQGVKEFGSDLKKLGLPVEHAPQLSQLFKIGSHNYEDMKQFMVYIDELLFKYNVHRDRALTYKMEEVQVTAVDELYVEQNAEGAVMKQICRVRLFFLGFLSGMPTIELGVNDLWRQGKEVVGRHDIIPVVTEEWIRLEGVEFHSCVQQNEYERSRTIRFQPPDACYIELMRFRVRPPKNRELPFQLKAVWCVTGNKVELRADVLVPGFASRKLGQIPCEDVSIRFPIPECWIYLFRVEKHFRYGSVKSAHRRTGKIKGIERILGTVDQVQESLIEVTSGQAKYEHHHRAIVWRCPRLPKEGQGAYTTHQLVVRMALTSYDQIPEQLAPYCYVEFTMPATQVSHMTVRSVSVQDSDSDDPPEKYVRYLARHEYRVGIEHTTGDSLNPYLAATAARKPEPVKEEPVAASMPAIAGSDSDSDSN